MKTETYDLSMTWQLCFMVMLSAIIVMFPDFAFAEIDSPMGSTLCNAAEFFQGNAGKGIATIGVCVLGVGALLGKISWGLAMVVGVGIAMIFGVGSVIRLLDPAADTCLNIN